MWRNRFVCPVPKWLRGELSEYNRLYAYPNIPEIIGDAEFIILDSGAYHFSKAKKTMNKEYISVLAEHYQKYSSENIFCVAPDVAGDLRKTIKNYEYFISKYEIDVVPVLQFTSHNFDWGELRFQIDFYKSLGYEQKQFFFSKRGAYATELISVNIHDKIQYIIDELNVEWVHLFAAGWTLKELQILNQIRNNITVDTIAYYQSATDKDKNLRDWGHGYNDKMKNAKENAKKANYVMSMRR